MERVLQIGVKLILYDPRSEVFLALKRSTLEGCQHRESYDIPGGRLKPGEEPLEALRREVSEETGYVIWGDPVLVSAQNVLSTDSKQVVRLTYMLEDTLDALDIELSDEHEAYEFLPLEERNEFIELLNEAIRRSKEMYSFVKHRSANSQMRRNAS